MKNQREIYEALLAGETLFWDEDIIHLDENGFLVNENGLLESWIFSEPEKWQIYKEPKWYENIPDGGVLCKCGTGDYINVIYSISTDDGGERIFLDKETWWYFATPLTRKEVNTFLNNVPEGL